MNPKTLPIALLLCAGVAHAQQNPFAPPRAKLQYAPDRVADLLHVDVELDVDYPNRTINGVSTSTFSAMRNGITSLILHAGKDLKITKVTLDGTRASYTREGGELTIKLPEKKKGQQFKVAVTYSGSNAKGGSFGSGGGWHWIQPGNNNPIPTRVGFWTQGETNYNSEWAPTWDYPNDLATSETRTTVQADWDVIGNGVLVGTKLSPDKKRKTFTWRMSQVHATYLLSVVGGPFDIKKDKWEGVDLWYVVPRGSGYLIDDSFGHTKDMLSFFSKNLGVKYPWPKYAQNAMYDFGGGMENVSATTMGEGNLTEARSGYFLMDSLNSHELAHQWFGDLVTCKDWGDAWLNESFATFMESLYMEHSRGKNEYDYDIEGNMRAYFGEARRYQRPISTKLYGHPDDMFDSHTYPKGGVVLHSLRRMLGDEAFYAGLNYYLTKWRHTPVESAQLRRAFTEATGINVEPFWAQWFDKPGHPVLDYTWKLEDGKVKLTVKQTQDTSNGTPIYDIPTKVDIMGAIGNHTIVPIRLSKAEETFELPAVGSVSAVVLDPYHDFLRQIPNLHSSETELVYIAKFGLNAPDRAEALRQLLANTSDGNVKIATELLDADLSLSPVFRTLQPLVNLAKPELRGFWLNQLKSENFSRRTQAVQALAKLPADAGTTTTLRGLITDKAPISVVVASINALVAWDAKANLDVFTKAQAFKDRRGQIKRAADAAVEKAKA